MTTTEKKKTMFGKKIAVILFYIMFVYSGFKKITLFPKKVNVLQNKTNVNRFLAEIGMILVIILEIIGSFIIIIDTFYPKTINKEIVNFTYLSFLLFLIVVTAIYHPPTQQMIPFMSNLTTFAGILYLYYDWLGQGRCLSHN